MSAVDLTDAHEVLISEFETLEREFDQHRLAAGRTEKKLREEIRELRRQLASAIAEIEELQKILERAYIES